MGRNPKREEAFPLPSSSLPSSSLSPFEGRTSFDRVLYPKEPLFLGCCSINLDQVPNLHSLCVSLRVCVCLGGKMMDPHSPPLVWWREQVVTFCFVLWKYIHTPSTQLFVSKQQ